MSYHTLSGGSYAAERALDSLLLHGASVAAKVIRLEIAVEVSVEMLSRIKQNAFINLLVSNNYYY